MTTRSLLSALACVTLAIAQQSCDTARERRITFSQGRALAPQLGPDDGVLEVIQFASHPFSFYPGDVTALEADVRYADFVAIVEVTRKKSTFTPGGDWIQSETTAQLVQTLKDVAGAPADAGRRVIFEEDGGEISVGTQRIRARKSWLELTRLGGEYVVFGWLTGNFLQINPAATREIAGDQMVTLTRNGGGPTQEPQPVDFFLREIQSKAHLPRLGR